MLIKEFIANEWADYAHYDNQCSLPNIIDGLKITQRKALYTATQLPKGDKPIRVSQFSAKAAEVTAYHHGEVSMVSTVVGLAQDYPGSNNYPLMEKHGQFGSRLSNESASPRYIHTRLHKNWDKFFKKEDQEIVEYNYDDGDKIEPKFYIPMIPLILLNGADGLGNGYKSLILNYDVPDIVKALKEMVKHGAVKTKILPKIIGWTGKITKEDRQVTFTGVLKVVNTTKIHITELPPHYDNEKYKKLLNKLQEDEVIKEYKNHSSEDKWDWVIECPRETTKMTETALLEKFGLVSKVTENFVGWGVDDSAPMTFDGPEALIEYWYAEKLKLYASSIKNQIKVAKARIIKLNLKIKFVEWCLKNDFRKLSKSEFIEKSMAGVKNLLAADANEFVSMSMYRITTDEVAKAMKEMDDQLDILDELEALTPLGLMEKDLKQLS